MRPDLDREVGVIGADSIGAVMRRQNAHPIPHRNRCRVSGATAAGNHQRIPRGDHASASDPQGAPSRLGRDERLANPEERGHRVAVMRATFTANSSGRGPAA